MFLWIYRICAIFISLPVISILQTMTIAQFSFVLHTLHMCKSPKSLTHCMCIRFPLTHRREYVPKKIHTHQCRADIKPQHMFFLLLSHASVSSFKLYSDNMMTMAMTLLLLLLLMLVLVLLSSSSWSSSQSVYETPCSCPYSYWYVILVIIFLVLLKTLFLLSSVLECECMRFSCNNFEFSLLV